MLYLLAQHHICSPQSWVELSFPSLPLRVRSLRGQMSTEPFPLLVPSLCDSSSAENVRAPVTGEYVKIETGGFCGAAAS